MKIAIETITPEIAAKYLKRIDPAMQRTLMPRIVDNYARTMKAGHWVLSPEGIAFDEKDRLINGMHRMYAVVKSGRTIQLPVAYDVPEKSNGTRTIDVLDCGKNRNVGQQLGLTNQGMGNPMLVAAICRALLITFGNSKMSNTMPLTLAVLKLYQKEIQFCMDHAFWLPRVRNASVLAGFVVAMGYEARGSQMQAMYVATMNGENLKKGSPILALRNHLLTGKISTQTRGGSVSVTSTIVCAVTLCAMHVLNNKPIESIRYSDMGLNFFKSKQERRIKIVRQFCGLE